MKLRILRLGLLIVLSLAVVNAFSLDREVFTFVSYDLNVRVEPAQQRLAVRGKIVLRNDSSTPQKVAVLQISSSLDWRAVKAGDKPLQFVSQTYTSDIDHTGALSEAIVTLPGAVPPKGTVELDLAYEGVITLDATRLERLGTPTAQANSSDWDQISTKFTAVRGAGYVAWYPIATEAASLSEAPDLFEVLGRWKMREMASTMQLEVTVPIADDKEKPELMVNATACPAAHEAGHQFLADCTYRSLGLIVPTFVIANYEADDRATIEVHYLHGHDASANSYADAAEKVVPFITDWFGVPRSKAETADLNDASAAPFESGSFLLMPLLTPLGGTDPKLAGLVAAHQLTHSAFSSPRPWINEGLAHFAQALYLENARGRQAALDYMGLHRSAFAGADGVEKQTTPPRSDDEMNRSLVNTYDEERYRSKAMCVWWMLRDMVGDQALKKAIASYRAEQDKEPSYMPRLIQAQTQHDLEWFFDDWVYRDRGLPNFKVESVFPRKTLKEAYMLTITVANLGTAGAEVPLTVKFGKGEATKRIEIRAKSKTVIRMEVSSLPAEVVVNDGSVPESDTTNNVFKVEAGAAK
ncbi:MAG: M1 family aminopeptidase [Candidatus Sulfotelmatobacter sp.]